MFRLWYAVSRAYGCILTPFHWPSWPQIWNFWVACWVKRMMPLCHVWGWYPPQTTLYIHIRYMQCVWVYGMLSQGHMGVFVYNSKARLAPAWGLLGVVQAWVAHFVTPLKCMYDEYNWGVTSQKPHKKHKSPKKYHHHGGEAANPSSGVDLMNPRRPRGGRPCAHLFSGRHWRILFDSLN